MGKLRGYWIMESRCRRTCRWVKRVVCLGLLLGAAGYASAAEAELPTGVDRELAIDMSLAYMGADAATAKHVRENLHVQKTTCDTSLLLPSDLRSGSGIAWQVILSDFTFTQPKNDWIESSRYVRDVQVTIDSATGTLVEIRVLPISAGRIFPPELTAAKEASRLRRDGEDYVGYPADTPHVSFLSVLDTADATVGQASKVVVRLLTWRDENSIASGSEVRTVWVVHFYGMDPKGWHHGHVRTVYDAQTGSMLRTGCSPGITYDDLREAGWTRQECSRLTGQTIPEHVWERHSPGR